MEERDGWQLSVGQWLYGMGMDEREQSSCRSIGSVLGFMKGRSVVGGGADVGANMAPSRDHVRNGLPSGRAGKLHDAIRE